MIMHNQTLIYTGSTPTTQRVENVSRYNIWFTNSSILFAAGHLNFSEIIILSLLGYD